MITEADPNVLARQDLQLWVGHSFLDQSATVREACPDLIEKYYDILSLRILDTGVSVRRRVIRVLRDICVGHPSFPKIHEICVRMIGRVNDEDGIRKLVLDVFQNMWLTPMRANPCLDTQTLHRKVINITEVVALCDNMGLDFVEQLFLQIFKSKDDRESDRENGKNREPPKTISTASIQIVNYLVEHVLFLEEISNVQNTSFSAERFSACIATLYMFARIRPQPLVNHASTLGAYLTVLCHTNAEVKTIANIAATLELVVPLMVNPAESFLTQLEEDCVKLIFRNYRDVIESCVACLGAVINKITRNYSLVRDLLRKFHSILQTQIGILSTDPCGLKSVDQPRLRRAIYTIGLVLRYFDFTNQEVCGDLPMTVVNIIFFLVDQPAMHLQFFGLQAIGNACVRCVQKHSKVEDIKDLDDVASGMSSTIVQIYMKELSASYHHPDVSVRTAVFRLILTILQQGLVHPLQIVPSLICMSTDTETGISIVANKKLMEIGKKQPNFNDLNCTLESRNRNRGGEEEDHPTAGSYDEDVVASNKGWGIPEGLILRGGGLNSTRSSVLVSTSGCPGISPQQIVHPLVVPSTSASVLPSTSASVLPSTGRMNRVLGLLKDHGLEITDSRQSKAMQFIGRRGRKPSKDDIRLYLETEGICRLCLSQPAFAEFSIWLHHMAVQHRVGAVVCDHCKFPQRADRPHDCETQPHKWAPPLVKDSTHAKKLDRKSLVKDKIPAKKIRRQNPKKKKTPTTRKKIGIRNPSRPAELSPRASVSPSPPSPLLCPSTLSPSPSFPLASSASTFPDSSDDNVIADYTLNYEKNDDASDVSSIDKFSLSEKSGDHYLELLEKLRKVEKEAQRQSYDFEKARQEWSKEKLEMRLTFDGEITKMQHGYDEAKNRLEMENESIRKRLETSQETVEIQEAEVTRISTDLVNLRSLNHQLSEKLAETNTRLNNTMTEKMDIEQELSTLRVKADETEALNKDARQRFSFDTDKIKALNDEVTRFKAKADADEENSRLKMEEIQKSLYTANETIRRSEQNFMERMEGQRKMVKSLKKELSTAQQNLEKIVREANIKIQGCQQLITELKDARDKKATKICRLKDAISLHEKDEKYKCVVRIPPTNVIIQSTDFPDVTGKKRNSKADFPCHPRFRPRSKAKARIYPFFGGPEPTDRKIFLDGANIGRYGPGEYHKDDKNVKLIDGEYLMAAYNYLKSQKIDENSQIRFVFHASHRQNDFEYFKKISAFVHLRDIAKVVDFTYTRGVSDDDVILHNAVEQVGYVISNDYFWEYFIEDPVLDRFLEESQFRFRIWTDKKTREHHFETLDLYENGTRHLCKQDIKKKIEKGFDGWKAIYDEVQLGCSR